MRFLLFFLTFPFSVYAENITTFDVGEIAEHLVQEAECKEIVDAIQTVGAAKTERHTILNISFVLYSSGYAAGTSKPIDFIQSEMLSFCFQNPNAKIRDFKL